MNQSAAIAFNLLFNSALSYGAALTLVALVIRLGRVTSSSCKLYLYSLPSLKVLWDGLQGIPAESYIFSGLNFLDLPPSLRGVIAATLEYSSWGPRLALTLGVTTSQAMATPFVSVSAGDVLFTALDNTLGRQLPEALTAVCLGVSCLLILRRLLSYAMFELARRKDRRLSVGLTRIKLTGRFVDVYLSAAFGGSPFTGGLIRPYICFPQSTYDCLTAEEQQAALAHELAHIRHLDIAQTMLQGVVCDALWFLPFSKVMLAKQDELREILADRCAASTLKQKKALALALCKLAGLKLEKEAARKNPCSALGRKAGLLKHRIKLLLDEPTHRASYDERRWLWRALGLALASVPVFALSLAHNYRISTPPLAAVAIFDSKQHEGDVIAWVPLAVPVPVSGPMP